MNRTEQENPRPRVLHIITSLDTGGAEMMLYKLLAGPERNACVSRVVSLLPHGDVSAMISALGVEIQSLGMERGRPGAAAFSRLVSIIRSFSPHVVQTWLYHADLMGFAAACAALRGKVVWNIRCANMDLGHYGGTTSFARRACAALSRFPWAVVANSNAGKRFHESLGYRPRRFEVIPNAFDTDLFTPGDMARAAARREMGISLNAPVIGMVARFDRMKGHRVFVEAAGLFLKERPDARFVLIGEGADPANPLLAAWARESGVEGALVLLGKQRDMHRLYPALDVAVNASSGEGFSNAVGEAMCCQVPCVVTDVGDSALIVGDTGVVVRPDDPRDLASGWGAVLGMDAEKRLAMGARARARMVERYSLASVQGMYHTLYREAALGR